MAEYIMLPIERQSQFRASPRPPGKKEGKSHSGMWFSAFLRRAQAMLTSAKTALAIVTPCDLHMARISRVLSGSMTRVSTNVWRFAAGLGGARSKAWPPCCESEVRGRQRQSGGGAREGRGRTICLAWLFINSTLATAFWKAPAERGIASRFSVLTGIGLACSKEGGSRGSVHSGAKIERV